MINLLKKSSNFSLKKQDKGAQAAKHWREAFIKHVFPEKKREREERKERKKGEGKVRRRGKGKGRRGRRTKVLKTTFSLVNSC